MDEEQRSAYTPDTDEVRACYIDTHCGDPNCADHDLECPAEGAFFCWVADHDREVIAQANREARAKGARRDVDAEEIGALILDLEAREGATTQSVAKGLAAWLNVRQRNVGYGLYFGTASGMEDWNNRDTRCTGVPAGDGRTGINLLADLGYDDKSPQVRKAREDAAAETHLPSRVTDALRSINHPVHSKRPTLLSLVVLLQEARDALEAIAAESEWEYLVVNGLGYPQYTAPTLAEAQRSIATETRRFATKPKRAILRRRARRAGPWEAADAEIVKNAEKRTNGPDECQPM